MFRAYRNFASAVLEAANLGDDADTTAAIVRKLAGAHYGIGQIPPGWLQKPFLREDIDETALALLQASGAGSQPRTAT